MISLLLSVTTGSDFRASRRRLFAWLIYGGIVCVLAPLFFLTVSIGVASLILGMSIAVYVVGLLLPVLLVPIAARRLTGFSNSRVNDTALGVFYLLAPTREWLLERGVDLLRLDQFAALLISSQTLQLWGSGRSPRLLYESKLKPGAEASWGRLDGYTCMMLHLDDGDALPLLQWKEVLSVRQEWQAGWIDQIRNAAGQVPGAGRAEDAQ